MNFNDIVKYVSKVVEVIWYDAAGKQKEDINKVMLIQPKELLIKTTSYGLLCSVDLDAIMILHEYSDQEVDYTVIPNSWIIKIKELK